MRWVCMALLLVGCGDDDAPVREKTPPAPPPIVDDGPPLPPVPAFEPELGVRYELDYRGSLRLNLEGEDGVVLETSTTLTITPRGEALGSFTLFPGMYESAVRPENSYFDWDWPLQSLSSDRPIDVEVDDWTITIVPATPVPPGEAWRIDLASVSGVAVLESLDIDALFGEQSRWARMAGGAELVEMATILMQRFARTALTSSFAQDDFYVLSPPWPLPYDCGSNTDAFPPTECIARLRIPARIEVNMPPGWDTVLPSVADEPNVVSSIPSLIVTSPSMARTTTAVGDRTIHLCGPGVRMAALDDLAARVRVDVPLLEARLGPYPHEQLTVCLSPMPLTHGGLAHGGLALVEDAMFGAVLPVDGTSPEALRRLDEWIRTGAMFQAFREEVVLHELAHHWWRTGMPNRWEVLLDEGAASYIAHAALRERHVDADLGYFVDANFWINPARIESMGVPIPPLSQYLQHRGVAWTVAEDTLPYVHGYRLYEQLVAGRADSWETVRAILRDGPAMAVDAEALLDALPGARHTLRRVIERDEPVVARDHVNLATYSFRESIALLDKELRQAQMSPLALLAIMHRPESQQRSAQMYARLMGADTADWYLTSAVMMLLENEDCIERPEDRVSREACLELRDVDGRLTLAAVMELAALDTWIDVERDPDRWMELPLEEGLDAQLAMARHLATAPVRISADDMQRIAAVRPGDRAPAELLFSRMHARWAAGVYLSLFGG